MRKYKILTLFFILILFCFGCESVNTDENVTEANMAEGANLTGYYYNNTVQIYDVNNEFIDRLEYYTALLQVENSIIYGKLPSDKTSTKEEVCYYRYDLETKQHTKLFTVNNFRYAVFYNAVADEEHLYMLISTSVDDINSLYLYDINLISNEAESILLAEEGFVYNTMTLAGDTVYIVRLKNGGCYLDAYNTVTKELKTIKEYVFFNEKNAGEVIRQITSDSETVSVLRLKMESVTEFWLYIDVYDYDMNFLRCIDVTDMYVTGDFSVKDELRQLVAYFRFENNYLFYENFSSSRFCGEIQGEKLISLIDTDINFSTATEVCKDNLNVYFRAYNSEPRNTIYLFDAENGNIKEAVFNPKDERYLMSHMTRDEDSLLICFTGKREDNLPNVMYWVKLDELDFNDKK